METDYTIVVTDTDVLSCLCGTNDSNLKLIENHLGVSIYTRGNELCISSADDSVQSQFYAIIDCISQKITQGAEPTPDLIYAVLSSFDPIANSLALDNLSDLYIQIPGSTRRVYPKTANQAAFIRAMRSYDLLFCVGPAGSGKTFLAVAEALNLLLSRKKKKIILTRPVVEAGESLGFLPGDFEDKLHPYLRPLYDSMEALVSRETMAKLTENNMIEMAPLAYMRGRTLNDCVVILDEAQNTTVEQMKMFLTRMGENAHIIVTGDITQSDLPRRVPSGLEHAVAILRNIMEIGFIFTDVADVVRNPIVKKIVQAYENDYKK